METTAKNKQVIRNLYEQSMNKGNLALLKEFIAEDYTGIQGKKGVAVFEEPVVALTKAFPGIQWNIEDMIAEGNKVVVRWKWQGTHTGQFAQYIATGKTITNDGMGVFELKNGKVISSQIITDRVGFLQQVGALPADLGTLTNRK